MALHPVCRLQPGRRKGRGANKRPSSPGGEKDRGLAMPRTLIRCHKLPTRTSFSTAHRQRPKGLSHLGQTLQPGVPGLPQPASLEGAGQWPVCHADASPTEDPASLVSPPAHRGVNPAPRRLAYLATDTRRGHRGPSSGVGSSSATPFVHKDVLPDHRSVWFSADSRSALRRAAMPSPGTGNTADEPAPLGGAVSRRRE